jgi:hypothetical protein
MDGLHPRIKQEYEALAKQGVAKRSLPGVIKSIVESSGWGGGEHSTKGVDFWGFRGSNPELNRR